MKGRTFAVRKCYNGIIFLERNSGHLKAPLTIYVCMFVRAEKSLRSKINFTEIF